jgi:quercetin dioxygenase-like cupin family protein
MEGTKRCSPREFLEGESMIDEYVFISDLAKEAEIPANGILSRTIYDDDQIKVLLFGFDRGQELSEHTAAMPAVLHILQGEVFLTLGRDEMVTASGAWACLPPQLPHSVRAKTPVLMLLILIKGGKRKFSEKSTEGKK